MDNIADGPYFRAGGTYYLAGTCFRYKGGFPSTKNYVNIDRVRLTTAGGIEFVNIDSSLRLGLSGNLDECHEFVTDGAWYVCKDASYVSDWVQYLDPEVFAREYECRFDEPNLNDNIYHAKMEELISREELLEKSKGMPSAKYSTTEFFNTKEVLEKYFATPASMTEIANVETQPEKLSNVLMNNAPVIDIIWEPMILQTEAERNDIRNQLVDLDLMAMGVIPEKSSIIELLAQYNWRVVARNEYRHIIEIRHEIPHPNSNDFILINEECPIIRANRVFGKTLVQKVVKLLRDFDQRIINIQGDIS